MRCNTCGFLFTQDAPAPQCMDRYYKSPQYLPHETAHKGMWTKLIHMARNTIRMGSKVRMIKRYSGKTSGTLLDAGCGNGEFALAMKRAKWNVTGTESDQAMQSYCIQNGIDCTSPDDMSLLPDASMDAVTLWHSLEHMHDLHGTMKQIQRLLKSDGIALVALPNIGGPLMRFYGAHDVPRHLWHFRPDTFRKLAAMHALKIISIRPLRLDSLYMGLYYERFNKGWMPRGIILGLIDMLYSITGRNKAASLVYVLTHADAHSVSS